MSAQESRPAGAAPEVPAKSPEETVASTAKKRKNGVPASVIPGATVRNLPHGLAAVYLTHTQVALIDIGTWTLLDAMTDRPGEPLLDYYPEDNE